MADSDTVTFLLRALEENWLHARLSEERRATLTYVILLSTLVIQSMLTYLGPGQRSLLLAIFLPFISLYALLITIKLYERAQFHTRRARKLRARLNELLPDAQVEQLQHMAEEEHTLRYRWWMNTRLNTLWLTLYTALIVLGCIDILLCLLRR